MEIGLEGDASPFYAEIQKVNQAMGTMGAADDAAVDVRALFLGLPYGLLLGESPSLHGLRHGVYECRVLCPWENSFLFINRLADPV